MFNSHSLACFCSGVSPLCSPGSNGLLAQAGVGRTATRSAAATISPRRDYDYGDRARDRMPRRRGRVPDPGLGRVTRAQPGGAAAGSGQNRYADGSDEAESARPPRPARWHRQEPERLAALQDQRRAEDERTGPGGWYRLSPDQPGDVRRLLPPTPRPSRLPPSRHRQHHARCCGLHGGPHRGLEPRSLRMFVGHLLSGDLLSTFDT